MDSSLKAELALKVPMGKCPIDEDPSVGDNEPVWLLLTENWVLAGLACDGKNDPLPELERPNDGKLLNPLTAGPEDDSKLLLLLLPPL